AGRNLPEGGVLVSISSLNGRQPAAGMSAYCAAKAGLSMLTQVAALEMGPRGIRVVGVLPARIDTDRVRELDGMSADPAALQLRLLETVVEVAAEKNSTVVLPFPVELLRYLERATPQQQSSTRAVG
nr:SDR family NAD(P)-dependent oxidoreductase [Streptomyces sp. DSM 41633]